MRQGAALWLIRALLDRAEVGGAAAGLAEVIARFPAAANLPDLSRARPMLAVP